MDKGMMYNDGNIEHYTSKKEAYDSGFNDGYIAGRHDSDQYLWDAVKKGYDNISKAELMYAIKNYCGDVKATGENE